MKLTKEEGIVLALGAVATVTAAVGVTLAIQQKNAVPAIVAAVAAGGAACAACYLDGMHRSSLAKASEQEQEELFDAEECDAALREGRGTLGGATA